MSTSVIRLTVPKLCQNAIDFGRIGHILWSGAPFKLLKTGPGSKAMELLERYSLLEKQARSFYYGFHWF
jgi:hypothetical protein